MYGSQALDLLSKVRTGFPVVGRGTIAGSGILNRALCALYPHPILRLGLSREAGEANMRWRGTRHPNSDPHLDPLPNRERGRVGDLLGARGVD